MDKMVVSTRFGREETTGTEHLYTTTVMERDTQIDCVPAHRVPRVREDSNATVVRDWGIWEKTAQVQEEDSISHQKRGREETPKEARHGGKRRASTFTGKVQAA